MGGGGQVHSLDYDDDGDDARSKYITQTACLICVCVRVYVWER